MIVGDHEMIKVLSIIGTRPEAIKMAPVILELARHADQIVSRICVTAQHRQMLDQVLSFFKITPDYDLNVMQEVQSPVQTAAMILAKLEPILHIERPDWVLVQGDTTTVLAASLAAFYTGARLGHIEAGLRTYNKAQPFPEEIHRRITTLMADRHFVPTENARICLLREQVPASSIVLTGNTVIDALHIAKKQPYCFEAGPLATLPWQKRIILVTLHRRENFGQPLQEICEALRELACRYAQSTQIVYPVHMNPQVRKPVYQLLGNVPGITLLPPLDYQDLVNLLDRCYLVLTDSGGLQEEAPSLGKPVLVVRYTTERPEAIEAGTVKLIGPVYQRILEEVEYLLHNKQTYETMAHAVNPYGDGQAAQHIVSSLHNLTPTNSLFIPDHL
jgi:UDP-N-acetylglucosamine 2-epimerase (non-hydrolysing)